MAETRSYEAATEGEARGAFGMDFEQWRQAGWSPVATHWTGKELVVTYLPTPAATQPAQAATQPIAAAVDQRRAVLAREVARAVANGARIQSQDPYQAVVVYGRPVNHVLHLLLSIFTAGLWIFVWLIVGLTGGEKRELITIDEHGQVYRRGV
jgi:hypothetical protein